MKGPCLVLLWIFVALLKCQLLVAMEHMGMAKHAIKLHRGKVATVTQGRQWVIENCRKMSGLLLQKAVVLNKLKGAIRAVEKNPRLSDAEKLFQVHTFEIFQKELNESENSVFQAIHGLQREEQEFVKLMAAEKHQEVTLKSMQQQSKSLSILDEILEDVRKVADRLEEEIEEHAFDDNKLVEAVLRVEDDEQDSRRNYSKREVEYDLGLSMLIDSQNNQYILTKPRDSTMPRADHHFIKDIVTVVMLSLPCGWLCTVIVLPTMFGYIICGVLLGPSGLNSIKDIVTVVMLSLPCGWLCTVIVLPTMFGYIICGVLLGPSGLNSIKVKLYSLFKTIDCKVMVVTPVGLNRYLSNMHPRHDDHDTHQQYVQNGLENLSARTLLHDIPDGGFWLVMGTGFKNQTSADCLCSNLSVAVQHTTCVQVSFWECQGRKEGEIDYRSVLLGMLVMQDVLLSLFIAVMPTLIQAGGSNYNRPWKGLGFASPTSQATNGNLRPETLLRAIQSQRAEGVVCEVWRVDVRISVSNERSRWLDTAKLSLSDRENHTELERKAGGKKKLHWEDVSTGICCNTDRLNTRKLL
ncbi:Transmembrane and coiled-coil domain-containing protein 3 [Acipenser ruthenus]|uniref:Transmembrane and coiled-coil domain-containing protein 3 n=1 Tax=Acipenser ruthenus TaxID=7906 RepID=A0A662YKL6_ACIRT|nr:Transmembrane and coiled-coil domain-containing protein 3 [Acipenser ruthenus]